MSQGVINTILSQWNLNRERTFSTLQSISSLPNSSAILGWRPGLGRAHIAWQLAHIGVTEELFATERFLGTTPAYTDLLPRFKGGSTPDDDIPSIETIRELLSASREHLVATVLSLSEQQFDTVPPALQARNLTIGQALRILSWHEAHHQGQAHITLNLYKATHPT